MTTSVHEDVTLSRRGHSRRRFLHHVGAASLAAGTLSFRDVLSLQAAELRKRGKSMILLWMQGAPSQFETFDPKPGTPEGGETRAIKTNVPGIEIAHDWTETAKVMDHVSLIRSMTNKEGNHQRASYQLHTGYVPSGSVKHPSLQANVAQQIADPTSDLPSVVSVGGGRRGGSAGAGFLGVDYEPFTVDQPGRLPANVKNPVRTDRFSGRRDLLGKLESEYATRGAADLVADSKKIYGKAADLVLSPEVKAFDISSESDNLQERYGDTDFGRGCLLARRLVETGVTCVEVRHGNWDTHFDNFERTAELNGVVDPAMATLVTDLSDRGLLDDTLVVWIGEFGRTPRINGRGGRDHFPRCFNAALAGCGVKGGQVVGSSTKNGSDVADRPVTVPDLFHSICHALDVDVNHENMSPLGRPMKIVEGGSVVEELFA